MSISPRSGSGGGSFYVGLDPASAHAGAAAIDENGNLITRAIHVRGQMPNRLVALRAELREFLHPIADQGAWCTVIERPNTRHGGATLLASYGVFIEATASILRCPVLTLGPQEIDGPAGVRRGVGVDRKAAIRARALELGYGGDSQDVADAVVCAEAARHMTVRATRKDAA